MIEAEVDIETADGTKKWYRNGKLHREDGPAIERADGSKEWLRNGLSLNPPEIAAIQARIANRRQ